MRCLAMVIVIVRAVMPLAGEVSAADSEVVPAIKKVITMLDNLVTELDAEAKDDEAKITHFTDWAGKEITDTGVEIERVQGVVEELTSTLATLNAKKTEMSAQLQHLKGEISTAQGQINFATNKRNEEKSSFTAEQQDFDAAIAACGKAVKLLGAHYGDGSPAPELSKPDFVFLVRAVKKAALPTGRSGKALHRLNLLQGPNDRYEESTDDALNIVDQIKVLKSSFEDDKQSGIEDEQRLQGMYDKLMAEKTESLNTMKAERDSIQSRLQQTNQDIAENEGGLSRSQRELSDAQAHLALVTKNRDEAVSAYEVRKKDREEETEAVKHAAEVLAEYRDSFLQGATLLSKGRSGKKVAAAAKVAVHHQSRDQPCPTCGKAAKLLQTRAAELGSSMLKAAAEATAGLDALDDIVTSLDGLIDRLKEEQKTEKEHKEWCEKETSLTSTKRDNHASIVEELKAILANLGEVVVEKNDNLDVNHQDTNDEDTSFEELTELRDEEKTTYEHNAEEHKEAIMALNEAIDILAKYYASKKEKSASLLQDSETPPVVELIGGTRKEFEESLVHIEDEEKEAIKVYDDSKAMHVKVDNDLAEEKDTITVEKQTVESQIEQGQEDKKSNEDEVKSAQHYLDRLGKSCYPLLSRYDERKKLRKEEEKALKDAIDVLKNAA